MKKAYCCVGQDFWKKNCFPVWDLITTGKQLEKKTYFATKKYFKTLNDCEIMLLKYGNLMLPSGHILDLHCVRLSSAAFFCKNYTKFYFDAKYLKKGLNEWKGEGGGRIFGSFFSKNVPFLTNIERSPKFLEYALTRGISR